MYCMSLDRLVYFFLQTFLCKEKWLLNHNSILERNDSQLPWEEKVGFWNEAGFYLFLQLQFDFISPFPVYSPDLNSLFSSIVMCYCLWDNHLFFDCFPTAHLNVFLWIFAVYLHMLIGCSLPSSLCSVSHRHFAGGWLQSTYGWLPKCDISLFTVHLLLCLPG